MGRLAGRLSGDVVEREPPKPGGRVLTRHELPVPEPLGPSVHDLAPQHVAGPAASPDDGWPWPPPVMRSLWPADLPASGQALRLLPTDTRNLALILWKKFNRKPGSYDWNLS